MRKYLFTIVGLFCLLVSIPSCDWSCYSREGVGPSAEREGAPGKQSSERATDAELKDAMKASAKYMKNLESAMETGNWSSARVSAKKLEDLIGQRCVNLYIKTHGKAPRKFVLISQDFNSHVLKLLMAERYNKYDIARTHYVSMKEDCEKCHQEFREER